jgi:hypothetical protein
VGERERDERGERWCDVAHALWPPAKDHYTLLPPLQPSAPHSTPLQLLPRACASPYSNRLRSPYSSASCHSNGLAQLTTRPPATTQHTLYSPWRRYSRCSEQRENPSAQLEQLRRPELPSATRGSKVRRCMQRDPGLLTYRGVCPAAGHSPCSRSHCPRWRAWKEVPWRVWPSLRSVLLAVGALA